MIGKFTAIYVGSNGFGVLKGKGEEASVAFWAVRVFLYEEREKAFEMSCNGGWYVLKMLS